LIFKWFYLALEPLHTLCFAETHYILGQNDTDLVQGRIGGGGSCPIAIYTLLCLLPPANKWDMHKRPFLGIHVDDDDYIGLVNFLCERPCSKYFRLFGPYGFFYNCSPLPL